ncbi:MAG: peptidase M23 [Gammaproteobacteria bacterium]|nr:MAG: peptidase M23 [Gammaproteobacteria bacterium]
MRKSGRRLSGLALLTALFTTAAAGEELQQATRSLEQVRESIRAVREELKREQGEVGLLRQELERLDAAIDQGRRRLRELQTRIGQRQQALESLRAREAEHRLRLRAFRQALAAQLRAAYALGGQDTLRLVLNQRDPAALGRNLIYHEYLVRHRTERTRALLAELEELQQVERALQLESEDLRRLESEQQRQLEAIDKARGARKAIIARLEQGLQDKGKRLALLQRDEERLNQLIGQLRQAARGAPPARPFGKLRGRLPWPARGKVVRSFGSRRKDGTLRWQGMLISVPPGEPVRAVADGRVVFADWFRNLGQLVIIDHGDGYMSLYGHNQALFTRAGERVKGGEVIAESGDSGVSETPGLYFEIRHKGRPANPARWLARR